VKDEAKNKRNTTDRQHTKRNNENNILSPVIIEFSFCLLERKTITQCTIGQKSTPAAVDYSAALS